MLLCNPLRSKGYPLLSKGYPLLSKGWSIPQAAVMLRAAQGTEWLCRLRQAALAETALACAPRIVLCNSAMLPALVPLGWHAPGGCSGLRGALWLQEL